MPWQEVLDKLERTVGVERIKLERKVGVERIKLERTVEGERIKLEMRNVNVFKKRTSTDVLFFYFLKPHF